VKRKKWVNRDSRSHGIWISFVLVLMIIGPLPASLRERTQDKGDLVGHIYQSDGITPVEQAIVLIKKLTDKELYQSTPSDKNGVFVIGNIDKGVYILGVKTSSGNFTNSKLFGVLVSREKKAKVEILLTTGIEDAEEGLQIPLLPHPVGQVRIVAGNEFIFDGVAVIEDRPKEAGPFRIRAPD
jgi:hypothetical protein